jgi:serine/threonine protein kinase
MEIDVSTDVWKGIAGNVCSDKWNDEKIDWNKISVVERIGSESSEGEVYRLELKGQEFAGKILPITSDKNYEKNENEISIATELSGSPFFPTVYASSFCQRTKYNVRSRFYEESYKYFLFEKVCEGMKKSEKTRMKYKYKNYSIEELKSIFPNEIDIASHILISEIAFSDMRQIAKYYYVSEKNWLRLIINVLEGIQYLNEEKSILHGDLHCGNILIKIGETSVPLIHDFGKSERCSFTTMEERITDPQKFIYDLTLHPDVPEALKEKLEHILNFLSNLKENRPILKEIISKLI